MVDENDDSAELERKGSTVNEHHHECNFGLVQVVLAALYPLTVVPYFQSRRPVLIYVVTQQKVEK